MLSKCNTCCAFFRVEVATALLGFGTLCNPVQEAHAGELTALSDSTQPFSFAVLGDLHVSRPNFEARRIGRAIADAVKDVQPKLAFVCQTGDLILGELPSHKQLDKVGVKEELAFAVTSLSEQFQRPLFVAVGNHDKNAGGTPYQETVWPLLSRELGQSLTRSYFAFRFGNACFIFLDYGDYSDAGTGMDYAAQRKFLDETMAQAHATPAIKHVFVFGHYPLWPVVRPGFCNRRFTDSVVPALKQYPVDAYFCGHTHNTGAWVRRVDGVPITQIKGVVMDSSAALKPMDETRTLLIPRDELSYGWGYLSGPPNGFFLVSVDGSRVRVQFRSGREVLREFTWQEPGQIVDTVVPPPRLPVRVTADDVRQVTSATLVFTPWTETGADVAVLLNGQKIGQVRIDSMPRWAAFSSEVRVPIPSEKLAGLRLNNEVVFENPNKALFGIGNVRLDAKRADGSTAHSLVFDRFLFSADRAEAGALGQATFGWEIIPAAVTATVKLGEPLGPARLGFPDK